MADVGRSYRGGDGGAVDGHAIQAAGAAGDGLRRIETDTGKAGRPGTTVKLKIVETAFSARDVGAKRSLVLIVLARLCFDLGRTMKS